MTKAVVAFTVAVAALFGMTGTASASQRPSRLLVFGHSWAAGYGVPAGSDYADQLAAWTGRDLRNLAVSGSSAAQAATVVRSTHARPSDLVVINTGLNDMAAWGAAGLPAYRVAVRSMLRDLRGVQQVILLQESNVHWAQVPAPWRQGSYATMLRYRAVNAREAARWPNVAVVQAATHDHYQADGVHPDVMGHSLIAARLARVVSRHAARLAARSHRH